MEKHRECRNGVCLCVKCNLLICNKGAQVIQWGNSFQHILLELLSIHKKKNVP